ncbi:glycosyltransferase family 4 protein [Shimia marina]|uniref:GDP-mannose-dependent alpha-(1-2)-phosphatidylinositol mannosyltransferase n=1 Tax=Shimia marina TaxID=321267 RepID=A0A0P1F7S3_9RHOB|nr:glycosyltransferase family 4 protein [Shimia marina]CUH51061.1 GDP-mannose-dependent alpha-(1-2)-phosphatidylinositol mannosyltransferase [Shimia marina]SFD59092.1 Glycosyltransferase involved in cell wall bisynthesis [Shimia marina]
MKILFIHQNFPGQFKHLAPALVARGHDVRSITLRVKEAGDWKGVKLYPYAIKRKPAQGLHPWLVDFETKMLRAESCYAAARQLRDQEGYTPDVIVAHPGWGESMFLRDLWPTARIGLYAELYYTLNDTDTGFDPEFPKPNADTESIRLRLKNINNMMHRQSADLAISPTRFQAETFPDDYQDIISVIHDGIDTAQVAPNADANLTLPDGTILTREDEVITFVNRNLEPYRGYHVFMRALPDLLKARPNARVLMVGGDDVSYGAPPPQGKTWKQIYIDEVRGKIPTPNWERVHFLGKVPYDQFLSMLQISRAHVYLTYPFVLSWSLLEAMAIGAPIIASDTAPVKEVITHGETGRLFPFFDGARMVEEICTVLESPKMREDMATASRNFAVTHYDLETVCLPKQLEWIDRLFDMAPGALRS